MNGKSRKLPVGTVDALNNKVISGWIVPHGYGKPNKNKIRIMVSGKQIDFDVVFFFRRDLAKYQSVQSSGFSRIFDKLWTVSSKYFSKKNQDNLVPVTKNQYGFKATFRQPIKNLKELSIFYVDNRTINDFSINKKLKLPSIQNNKAHFVNFASAAAALYKIDNFGKDIAGNLTFSKKSKISTETKEMSETFVHVGIQCPTSTVITGKRGHIFLYGGSNRVDELYDLAPTIAQEKANKWHNVFTSRFKMGKELNFKYMQIIIPEKQSVIPELYFRTLCDSTPLLRLVENEESENYGFSCLKFLSEHEAKELAYYKTGSHLNVKGAYLVFARILEFLGSPAINQPTFTHKGFMVSDLGRKYTSMKLYEKNLTVRTKFKGKREKVSKFIPENRSHLGRKIIWHNEQALSKERVLVFGNSFFDLGAGANELSWWFSQYFQDFLFSWSPDFDEELIKEFHPTIVVGQTIERFLRTIPKR